MVTVISIEKYIVKTISLDNVIDEFASIKARIVPLLYRIKFEILNKFDFYETQLSKKKKKNCTFL